MLMIVKVSKATCKLAKIKQTKSNHHMSQLLVQLFILIIALLRIPPDETDAIEKQKKKIQLKRDEIDTFHGDHDANEPEIQAQLDDLIQMAEGATPAEGYDEIPDDIDDDPEDDGHVEGESEEAATASKAKANEDDPESEDDGQEEEPEPEEDEEDEDPSSSSSAEEDDEENEEEAPAPKKKVKKKAE